MKHKSTRAACLAVLFVLQLILSACVSSSTFTVLAAAVPANLDPQLAATAAEKTAVVNLFEGLYRKDESGTPLLAAAESVSVSDDGLVYTFILKQQSWGSYTANGTQHAPTLSADDFVFAFQRIFTASTRSPWASTFSGIKNAPDVLEGALPVEYLGVKAPGESTLEITLNSPDAAFPLKLCGAGAMPCNRAFFEATKGSYGLSYSMLLTNGPFTITRWTPGEVLTLERSTKVSGWVKNIRFAPAEGEKSSDAGRYAAGEGSGALLPGEEENENQSFTGTTWVLVFNTRQGFLANKTLRGSLATVAIQAAEEYHSLVENSGSLLPATGLLPGGIPATSGGSYRAATGTNQSLLPNAQSAFRSETQALAQDGESSSAIPSLTLLVPQEEPYATLAQSVNQQWQAQLYCFFAVEQASVEAIRTSVEAGAFDIALLPLYAPTEDGLDMLGDAAALTQAGWDSAAFTGALAAVRAETQPERRDTLTAQAENALLAEWALAPLAFETSHFATRARYNGLSVDPFGPVLEFSAPAASKE